jgi:uncharacterized protein with PIN domain
VSVKAVVSGRASRSCLLDVVVEVVAARAQHAPVKRCGRCEGAAERSTDADVTLCPSCGTVRLTWEGSHVP